MKNCIKFLGVTSLVMAIGISSVACKNDGGSRPSALVGTWENESYGGMDHNEMPKDMELFKDGTGVVDNKSTPWKVENNRLILNYAGMISYAYSYEIKGVELTLSGKYSDASYEKIKK